VVSCAWWYVIIYILLLLVYHVNNRRICLIAVWENVTSLYYTVRHLILAHVYSIYLGLWIERNINKWIRIFVFMTTKLGARRRYNRRYDVIPRCVRVNTMRPRQPSASSVSDILFNSSTFRRIRVHHICSNIGCEIF